MLLYCNCNMTSLEAYRRAMLWTGDFSPWRLQNQECFVCMEIKKFSRFSLLELYKSFFFQRNALAEETVHRADTSG